MSLESLTYDELEILWNHNLGEIATQSTRGGGMVLDPASWRIIRRRIETLMGRIDRIYEAVEKKDVAPTTEG